MISSIGLEEIRELCANPNHVSYCVMMLRPGVHAWTVELEYTMFKPDTDANDGFHMATVKWPPGVPGLAGVYVVVIFEKRAQEFAESILWKHGLRKVKEGFVQMMMSPGGKIDKFPITGPNVFFLENHSKGAANVIYTNDPVKIEAARKHEMKQAQKFFDDHKRWLDTPTGRASFKAYWEKHPSGHAE